MTDLVPWQIGPEGITLVLRLTPNARDERIDGVQVLADGRAVLGARVRAVPEDGAANDAIIRLLSKTLKLPKSRIALKSGATQRQKIFVLAGAGQDVVQKLVNLAT